MRLRLISEPIERTREGLPAVGLRRLAVRDDLGREVEVDFLACGQLGEIIADTFEGVQITGEQTDPQSVVRHATLDAGAEYLLLLVRCDAAELG